MEPEDQPPAAASTPAPIPRTFGEYVRAMGPGIVVVLTWLGAGDIVDGAAMGGNYGYALMWAFALSLVVRWLFVSTIAKYQLCNQHGESVMEGLRRLSAFFPPFIFFSSIVLSHIIGAYLYQGLGESCAALAGAGPPWAWALGWAVAFFLLVARPAFRLMERIFLVFLALLSVSLLGAAAWVGPDWTKMLVGAVTFQVPPQRADFDPLLLATSLLGAVAGSLANLMYPYFIRDKGWTTPAHRRVQIYDLAFGVSVMIVLDLAIWVVGAEVLHPRGLEVKTTGDLANLLTHVVGPWGSSLIYLGIFAAVASTIVGNAFAYGYMTTDAYLLWRPPPGGRHPDAYRTHPGYRWMVCWVLFSPLAWVLSGRTEFVALTITVNALQVLLLPVLAIGIWLLTSTRRCIGDQYRNRWWEHALMAILLLIGSLATWQTIEKMVTRG